MKWFFGFAWLYNINPITCNVCISKVWFSLLWKNYNHWEGMNCSCTNKKERRSIISNLTLAMSFIRNVQIIQFFLSPRSTKRKKKRTKCLAPVLLYLKHWSRQKLTSLEPCLAVVSSHKCMQALPSTQSCIYQTCKPTVVCSKNITMS